MTDPKHLESIGFAEKPADGFTPYCHLEICRRCGQQKMCVEGVRYDGNERSSFWECEDCSHETNRIFQIAELERAVIERATKWAAMVVEHDFELGPEESTLQSAVDVLLKARENK